MVRYSCNFCQYKLNVTEALAAWAEGVMLAHVKRSHPDELIKATLAKETPADEKASE